MPELPKGMLSPEYVKDHCQTLYSRIDELEEELKRYKAKDEQNTRIINILDKSLKNQKAVSENMAKSVKEALRMLVGSPPATTLADALEDYTKRSTRL